MKKFILFLLVLSPAMIESVPDHSTYAKHQKRGTADNGQTDAVGIDSFNAQDAYQKVMAEIDFLKKQVKHQEDTIKEVEIFKRHSEEEYKKLEERAQISYSILYALELGLVGFLGYQFLKCMASPNTAR